MPLVAGKINWTVLIYDQAINYSCSDSKWNSKSCLCFKNCNSARNNSFVCKFKDRVSRESLSILIWMLLWLRLKQSSATSWKMFSQFYLQIKQTKKYFLVKSGNNSALIEWLCWIVTQDTRLKMLIFSFPFSDRNVSFKWANSLHFSRSQKQR